MAGASRRAILATIAAAAAAVPFALARRAPQREAIEELLHVSSTSDLYASNTELYSTGGVAEGTDYARRYKRHEQFDDSAAQKFPFTKTAIIAPHGGGIEAGTSELCLAVAGYDPKDLAATPAGGPAHDYWMFEGIRSSNNAELHVTSTHCDDGVALAFAAGSRNALGLHGCSTTAAGLPDGTQAALVGGRSGTFKQYLIQELTAAGFQAIDAASNEALKGEDPENIANRTLVGAGGQLEITTPLRAAMFGTNTIAQRKNTTTAVFWSFTAAIRTAIARLEAGQVVL